MEQGIAAHRDVEKSHRVFSVRFTADLYNRLKDAAKEDERKPNGMIVAAVEQYLERRRVGIEGAALHFAEFDRARMKDVALDKTLKMAAETQAATRSMQGETGE